ARRLAAAGFPMVVYDRDPEKAAGFHALGATVAPDAAGLVRGAEVVLSCVADDNAIEDIYFGTHKLLENAGPHNKIIDLSTVAPQTSRRLYDAGRRLGISVLDVAISGSTSAAEAATLTLFGGGERGEFEAAQPIFGAIATQWFYMGPSGSGVAMKL